MKNLWVDIETGGLNPKKHDILEVAAIYTEDLEPQAEFHCVIKLTKKRIRKRVSYFCAEMHAENGLIEECLYSGASHVLPFDGFIHQFLEFLDRCDFGHEKIVLCGSSVQFDMSFLREIPEIAQRLHYRIMDVSSIIRFMKMTTGHELAKCGSNHRAMDDIGETLKAARWCRDVFAKGVNDV